MLSAIVLAAATVLAPAKEISRLPAPEASQGVAVDARYLYAVGNSEIGKYDRKTGERVALWKGDPHEFPHMNSCAVVGAEMVCATSNYPATPMTSAVEVFDPAKMTHLRTVSLGHQFGSLTWVVRRGHAWYACFANYDGRGGEPGRDHRATTLVMFDDAWKAGASWTFPAEVLDRMAPRSASGGVMDAEGRLYVTGHDRGELYILRIPKTGTVLDYIGQVEVPIEGQAIALDPAGGVIFGISRAKREVVAMQLPSLEGK